MAEAPQPNTVASRWPPQIKYIVGNEACERFSYYGMKGILTGYITGKVLEGGLGQTKDYSTELIHYFTSANYFMPLLGAWLSDKIIGRYHTILWVSLFYCAGHGVLACSDFAGDVHGKMICLFTGLALIAFGSGGIKPCVSAFMGDQFRPEQSHLMQKAYGVFYMSINIGSFFSFWVIPWIQAHYNYGLAFGTPGLLMAIATFIFWLGTKHYVRVPPARVTRNAGFFRVYFAALRYAPEYYSWALVNLAATILLPGLAMILMALQGFLGDASTQKFLGWTALGCIAIWYVLVLGLNFLRVTELPEKFWQGAIKTFSQQEVSSARSLIPILFVFAFVPVFWSLFDQMNTTWVSQGEAMVPASIYGLKIGADQMQSLNPALVMIYVPLFTLVIYPRMGRFAAPLRRMSYGMFIASTSFLVVAVLQSWIEHGEHVSILWQAAPYIVLTAAEVLISTTGLEFAFREAAPEMKSLIMGLWLLTVAFGDLFVAAITKLFTNAAGNSSVSTERFMQYAGLTFLVAILFSIVAAFYKYRDPMAAKGK